MSTTFQELVRLTKIDCGDCGATYAINERFRAKCAEEGKSWHCPYCQVGWGYTNNNENARLKKKLEVAREAEARASKRRDEALAEAEHFRKSRDGMKGALRKVCVRVKNGVCPCCKRTFKCLADHMAQKHPEFSTNNTGGQP